jgi:hypothetical protein
MTDPLLQKADQLLRELAQKLPGWEENLTEAETFLSQEQK